MATASTNQVFGGRTALSVQVGAEPAVSVAVEGVAAQPLQATVHTDPMMALVLVVLVALSVVGFALYVAQLAIKAGKRR